MVKEFMKNVIQRTNLRDLTIIAKQYNEESGFEGSFSFRKATPEEVPTDNQNIQNVQQHDEENELNEEDQDEENEDEDEDDFYDLEITGNIKLGMLDGKYEMKLFINNNLEISCKCNMKNNKPDGFVYMKDQGRGTISIEKYKDGKLGELGIHILNLSREDVNETDYHDLYSKPLIEDYFVKKIFRTYSYQQIGNIKTAQEVMEEITSSMGEDQKYRKKAITYLYDYFNRNVYDGKVIKKDSYTISYENDTYKKFSEQFISRDTYDEICVTTFDISNVNRYQGLPSIEDIVMCSDLNVRENHLQQLGCSVGQLPTIKTNHGTYKPGDNDGSYKGRYQSYGIPGLEKIDLIPEKGDYIYLIILIIGLHTII